MSLAVKIYYLNRSTVLLIKRVNHAQFRILYVVSSFLLVNLNLNTYTIKTVTSSFLDLINYISVLVDKEAQNGYGFVSPISLTNCHFYSFTQSKAVFPKNFIHFTVYCCCSLSLLQCKLIKPLKLNKGI